MNNVTDINKNKALEAEFENVEYNLESKGTIGVKIKDKWVSIFGANSKDEFMIILNAEVEVLEREKLAEFLWVAATLVDSEERWRPVDVELVGVDYV